MKLLFTYASSKLVNPFFCLSWNLKVLVGGNNAYPMLWPLCSDYEAETLCTVNKVPTDLSVHDITWGIETFLKQKQLQIPHKIVKFLFSHGETEK